MKLNIKKLAQDLLKSREEGARLALPIHETLDALIKRVQELEVKSEHRRNVLVTAMRKLASKLIASEKRVKELEAVRTYVATSPPELPKLKPDFPPFPSNEALWNHAVLTGWWAAQPVPAAWWAAQPVQADEQMPPSLSMFATRADYEAAVAQYQTAIVPVKPWAEVGMVVKHIRTGGLYNVTSLGKCKINGDWASVVVYHSTDKGETFVREVEAFNANFEFSSQGEVVDSERYNWRCIKCGVDRVKSACAGSVLECPMIGIAQHGGGA